MMIMKLPKSLVIIFFITAPLCVGCLQGLGQRCQLQSDCSSGLICVIPAGGSLAEGGTCQQPNQGIDAGVDMSVAVDMSAVPDLMEEDLMSEEDASVVPDMFNPDATVVDLSL